MHEDNSETKAPSRPSAKAYDAEGDILIHAREIPGRYEEIREQGSGGIGRVLLVRDLHLGREIALKELAVGSSPNDATVTASAAAGKKTPRVVRFLREARITAQLEHPSIVPIYEMGQRADGTPYYTMKLIRGRTIERAIEEAGALSDRLDLLPHFVDLCQAIAYAHSRGIVHRDIKPSNVLVGEFGETVVIDWGIANAAGKTEPSAESGAPVAGGDDPDDRLTQHGQSLGTPRYMSPEQIRGDLAQIAEPSDVYALGIILYELLTGRHPYHDSDASSLFADVLKRDPAAVRSLESKAPAELEAICRRAMSRDPRGRYSTAGELVEELKRFQAGALVNAYQYNTMDRLRRFVRRYAAVLATATLAFAAVIAIGVFAIARIMQEQAATEAALYHSLMGLAQNAVGNHRLEEAIEALGRASTRYRGLEWGLVEDLCHPERLSLPHDEVVSFGAYSPDGTKIATGSGDGRAFVWDARTGQKLHELHSPPKDPFVRAVWSADGSRLVLTSSQEYTYIYDTRDYTELRHVRGYAPALSTDGNVLAVAKEHGQEVTLYDPSSGTVLRKFPPLPVHVIQLAISADGRRLAAGINNGSVWVWSLDSEAAWNTSPVHTSTRHVVFSPDSDVLLSSGSDGKCILWDADSGAELCRIEGHESSISWACFLPEGQRILTASSDRTVRMWDKETGKELARHEGFSGPLGFVSPSPDGSEFITHLDSSSGRIAAVIRPVIPLNQRRTLKGHNAAVNCLAFSPDGALLASGGGLPRNLDDDRVIFWDTRDNTIRREIKTGHGPVLGVAYFPDGTRIATGNEDGTASIYDVTTGQCLRTMSGHMKSCGSVAVSPDGAILATASWDNNAILWDAASGERRALLKGDWNRLDAVAFDPEGRLVATGGMEGYVRLYRVSDGQPDGELLPAEVQRNGELELNRRVSALAFSPDGTRLVAAGDTGRVTMWDMTRRRQIRTFKGHKSIVWAAAFSHDGRRLITAGKDAAIWFWDVETGAPVTFLERHKNVVNALALRGDDGQMASASSDNTIVLWPIRPWQASN
jgi:WD40 repeat protein/serine/threonine protein kinase